MYLRVWDKTKEKDGKNQAIYELHTPVEKNFATMRFMKTIIENILNAVQPDRFMVLLQEDDGQRRERT